MVMHIHVPDWLPALAVFLSAVTTRIAAQWAGQIPKESQYKGPNLAMNVIPVLTAKAAQCTAG